MVGIAIQKLVAKSKDQIPQHCQPLHAKKRFVFNATSVIFFRSCHTRISILLYITLEVISDADL